MGPGSWLAVMKMMKMFHPRAVNEPSQSFTVPEEGLLLVDVKLGCDDCPQRSKQKGCFKDLW